MSLLVDGKAVDSKPIKVGADAEVALTSAERIKLYDMAMELHALQPFVTDAATAHATLSAQVTAAGTALKAKADAPADVKAAFAALEKDVTATASKFAQPRGFGGGGAAMRDSIVVKTTQAKNGLMGGMWPTAQVLTAAAESKAQAPKAIAELNALLAKASTVSASLAKAGITMTVPSAVKVPPAPAPAKKG